MCPGIGEEVTAGSLSLAVMNCQGNATPLSCMQSLSHTATCADMLQLSSGRTRGPKESSCTDGEEVTAGSPRRGCQKGHSMAAADLVIPNLPRQSAVSACSHERWCRSVKCRSKLLAMMRRSWSGAKTMKQPAPKKMLLCLLCTAAAAAAALSACAAWPAAVDSFSALRLSRQVSTGLGWPAALFS